MKFSFLAIVKEKNLHEAAYRATYKVPTVLRFQVYGYEAFGYLVGGVVVAAVVKRVGGVGGGVGGVGGLVEYIHEIMLYWENLALGILLQHIKGFCNTSHLSSLFLPFS